MGWIGPASKNGAKMAAKYGPFVLQAWKVAGPKVKEYSAAKSDELAQRAKAFQDAESRVDGSVLRVPHQGRPVFVVLTGEEPVASYPVVEEPLDALIDRVDLSRRVTPQQRRERQLRSRAAAVRRRAAARGRDVTRRRPPY
ncbi:hypothetical protein [Nocardioides mesophilus]|uniref:Uncharacterized protein n=1 Tax=Nocardioides mesophilus TaxID=433659 RepID=A0A7G9R7P9_9ACTN|nr:hypothetical protein [Nocardioides mesophilus]QNN51624.1 hypothetical protein H9L09_13730 [Nocardioides mesophilus]